MLLRRCDFGQGVLGSWLRKHLPAKRLRHWENRMLHAHGEMYKESQQ